MKEASEEFMESLRSRGRSPQIDCPHRVWFDGSGEFMEVGELEGLEAKARDDNTKYIALDHSPTSIYYAGSTFVLDCDLCRIQLGNYEAFIWGNREQIADFMRNKAAKLAEDADSARFTELAIGRTK